MPTLDPKYSSFGLHLAFPCRMLFTQADFLHFLARSRTYHLRGESSALLPSWRGIFCIPLLVASTSPSRAPESAVCCCCRRAISAEKNKKVSVFKVFKQMGSHKLQSVEGACFMTNKICQVGRST